MYAPMRFIEQCNNVLQVSNVLSDQELKLNKLSKKYCLDYVKKDRARALLDVVTQSCKERGTRNLPWKVRRFSMVKLHQDWCNALELIGSDFDDWLMQIPLYMATDEWAKAKRVYKIERSIMKQFCTMKADDKVRTEAITKLPSKCFYIDYDGYQPFGADVEGCFVIYDHIDDVYVWRLLNVVKSDTIAYVHSDLMAQLSNTEDPTANISMGGFSDCLHIKLKNGLSVTFNEKLFIRFFMNFCTYLYAANNDVEYTERTKSIYKPRKQDQKPTNRIREIEEFGVGFKRAAKISMSTKKVRYTKAKDNPTTDRTVSSHFRCAHWHHYWVKDPENPGKKKLIVKWIDEIFVQGTDDNRITVHKVAR